MTGKKNEAPFLGDNVTLDFVNTKWTEHDRVVDALVSFRALVTWLQRAEHLSASDVRAMLRFEKSREATEALTTINSFRETLRGMLDEHWQHGTIGARYLDAINEQLASCGCARVLIHENGAVVLRVKYLFARPQDVLMPLANAAAELLAHEDLTRIKRCDSDCCDMYFLDTSRNRSRLWCDMAACGNRAKAAAYFRRVRAERVGASQANKSVGSRRRADSGR